MHGGAARPLTRYHNEGHGGDAPVYSRGIIMGDDELIRLYLAGDSRAFTHLAQRHLPRLLTIARSRARNVADAWDIAQDALLRASQRLHAFRFECSFGTWLFRLVVNASYDYYRPKVNAELPLVDADLGIADTLSYFHVDRFEGILWIADALSQLPPEQRDAVLLTDVMGFSVAEAASQLHCAPGTIKSRRARARDQLKGLLSVDAAA